MTILNIKPAISTGWDLIKPGYIWFKETSANFSFCQCTTQEKVKPDEILRFLSNQNKTLTNDFKLF